MSFRYDGLHLMVDASCAENSKLNNPACVTNVMEDIVRAIDMTMILPPITVKFPHATSEMHRILQRLRAEGLGSSATATQIAADLLEREKESYGYSTLVMIAESHLSIHTFPEFNFFTFDCYSCKGFDADVVMAILTKTFGIVKVKEYRQQRSFDFEGGDGNIPRLCVPTLN